MRKQLFVLCCVALLAITAGAQTYTAVLTGAAEVPNPGDPDGAGVALIRIEGSTVHYSIVAQNIGAPTGAHIHPGVAGVAGGVAVGFDVNTLSNGTVQNVSQSTIDQIVADPGAFYVNVHTGAHPGGAIRGQLQPMGDASPGALFVPVVGKVAGAAGSNFVTDMRIINRGTDTASVTLDFFQPQAGGSSGPYSFGEASPPVSRTISVAPGEQAVLDDIIGFLGASGLGGLRVTSTANVDVLTRVLNDLRATGQGTAGFAVAASGLADARTSGTLGFLSASSIEDINARIGFRTNIGYFNPTERDVTVTVTARRTADGSVLGSKTITLPAFGFVQRGVFEVIDSVPAADRVQPNFYVTWTTSDGPMFVYAAVVDNRTGDSVLVQ